MTMLIRCLIVLNILAWVMCADSHAQTLDLPAPVRDSGVAAREIPPWVKPQSVDVDHRSPPDTLSNGAEWLLFDRQVNQAEHPAADFRRLVVRVINENGLDHVSNLEFSFDPAYERLVLHHFRVLRDGIWQPRSDSLELRVLQREPELESRILNGALSLSVLVRDLRVGDVLDYAYTLEGVNPVFAGRQWGSLSLRWSEPLVKMSARLMLPSSSTVRVASRQLETAVPSSSLGGISEWSLIETQVPALLRDDNVPQWWDGWPRLEWSGYQDWASVASWAAPLFATDDSASGPVADLALALTEGHADPGQRFLAALRFVQGDIRYLGLEMGEGSHAPSAPETVLERRFGDCKDKTRLLLALLRKMDIPAQAALVHSDGLRGEIARLPSPGWFDHVIVRAEVGGSVYWVDPTRRAQMSALDALFQPDFGMALVVAPGVDQLEVMPAARPERTRLEFDMDNRAGFDAPAQIVVRTLYEGGAAERAREGFAAESREQTQKSYLDYYALYYPGLASAAPLEVVDDPERNTLQVIEHYQLANFWVEDEASQRRVASISEPDLLSMLDLPQQVERSAPLWQVHPRDFEASTRIRLPEDWTVEADTVTVEDPHFRFDRRVEVNAARTEVTLVGRLQSRSHEIAADQVAAYDANLRKARDEVGFEFSYTPAAVADFSFERDFNWLVALIALFIVGGATALARSLWRYDPPAATVAVAEPRLVGLGGWLILPTLGLMLAPLAVLVLLWTMADAFAMPTWTELTQVGGESYHPMWAPLLLLELSHVLIQGVVCCLLLALFLKRRSSAPRVYLAMLGFDVLMQSTIGVLTLAIGPKELREDASVLPAMFGTILVSAIWAAYFVESKRVKQTFVVRRNGRSQDLEARDAALSGSAPLRG